MVQLLGICRFSYPSAVGAFQTGHGTLEDLRAHLYAPERLDQRLFFLRHVALPAIASQTDPDFTLLLLIGDQLPDPWRSDLLKLAGEVPQIVPVIHPEGQIHREAVRDAMLPHRQMRTGAVGEFRLDDDDAVAVDFVETTRRLFEGAQGIFEEDGKLCLDLCAGHVLAFLEDGTVRAAPHKVRMWTPGQVIFRRPANPMSILDANHLQLWQRMPVLSWQGREMFVRGAHGGNDSSLGNRANLLRTSEPLPGKLDATLADRYRLDPAALADGWKRLAKRH